MRPKTTSANARTCYDAIYSNWHCQHTKISNGTYLKLNQSGIIIVNKTK